MKGDIKPYGPRPTKNNPGIDTRDRCGRLDLRAQDEIDAILLAMLYRVIFGNIGEAKRKCSRARLFVFLTTLVDVDMPAEYKQIKIRLQELDAKDRAAKKAKTTKK